MTWPTLQGTYCSCPERSEKFVRLGYRAVLDHKQPQRDNVGTLQRVPEQCIPSCFPCTSITNKRYMDQYGKIRKQLLGYSAWRHISLWQTTWCQKKSLRRHRGVLGDHSRTWIACRRTWGFRATVIQKEGGIYTNKTCFWHVNRNKEHLNKDMVKQTLLSSFLQADAPVEIKDGSFENVRALMDRDIPSTTTNEGGAELKADQAQ